MKNINAFFSFQKRVFAERLTHYAPYFFGVHAKPNLVAWEIRGSGHKGTSRNKYAYDAGAKCDVQHDTCYNAVCGVCDGWFHIDVFNKKLVLGLFLQIWIAALSTLKRPPAYEMKVIKASLYAQIYEKKRNNVKKKKQKCFILI